MVRLLQSGATPGVRTSGVDDHNEVRANPRGTRFSGEPDPDDLNSPTGATRLALDLPVNPVDDLRDDAVGLERNAS